jgi:phasin family protein
MADDSIGTPADDGQSIPAMLAAPKSAKLRAAKAPKVVAAAVGQPTPEPVVAPVAPAVIEAAAEHVAPAELPRSMSEVSAVAPAPAPPAAVPADSQLKEPAMATTIENVANTTTDKAQAMFADTSERAKGAMAKSAKMFEDMNAFGKGNVEALVESSKIAAKGIETLSQEAAEFTRKSFEDATAAFKTLSSVKSPTEFMKLQSDYVRASFDAMIAETSRSTETMLKLAGEVAQPISNRMAVAADKMKIAA